MDKKNKSPEKRGKIKDMKPLNLRKRALKGLTDYYIRRKTLVNYDQFIRLRFGKKNNYYYCGFYQTPSPALPDRCLGYFESRWLRTQGSIPKEQRLKLCFWGFSSSKNGFCLESKSNS